MKLSGIATVVFIICMWIPVFVVPAAYAQDVQKISITEGENLTEVMLPGLADDISQLPENLSESSLAVSGNALKSASMSAFDSPPLPRAGIEWQKVLGSRYSEEFASIRETSDGGYIACGMTGAYNANGDVNPPQRIGNGDAWIVKLDSSGNIVWQNVSGGRKRDECRSIRQTSDGGYVFVGFSNSSDEFTGLNNGEYDIFVVKLDNSGKKIWQHLLGGEYIDVGTSIRETSDGGYILTGFEDFSPTRSICSFSQQTNAWVMKLKQDGSLDWQKKFTGDRDVHGTSIIEARDGDFVLYGFTSSTSGEGISGNHGAYDLWVVKMDPTGQIIRWSTLYGGSGFEATSNVIDDGIQQTSDGGFVLVGQETSGSGEDESGEYPIANHGLSDTWIVKLSSTGSMQWQKAIGGEGDEIGGIIQETMDGGYFITARTGSSNNGDVGLNNGDWDIWAVKLDKPTVDKNGTYHAGEVLWQDVLGGDDSEQCLGMNTAGDGGYILSGRTISNSSGDVGYNKGGSGDGWVVKLTPRLTIIVRDNDTEAYIPNATVSLYDNKTNQWYNTTTSDGPVAIKGMTGSTPFVFKDNSEFSISVTADGYPQKNEDIKFLFTDPIKEYFLKTFIAPYDKSYSMTCIENYDHICDKDGKNCTIGDTFKECDNIGLALINRGYKENFYLKDDEVIKETFATDRTYTGPKLTDSAFHYHSGHGADGSKIGLGITATYLQLKKWDKFPNPLAYTVSAGDVEKKWGGKSKWVMLDSCNLLKDKNWGKALTTSHGILGYQSESWVHQDFGDMFFGYAIDQKRTIVDAYKMTTIEIYHDDEHTATVIAKSVPQIQNDQFPGIEGGHMEPDGDPANIQRYRYNWNCKKNGEEWWD